MFDIKPDYFLNAFVYIMIVCMVYMVLPSHSISHQTEFSYVNNSHIGHIYITMGGSGSFVISQTQNLTLCGVSHRVWNVVHVIA